MSREPFAFTNATLVKTLVESSVGSGELQSFTISGILVHRSTPASQPSPFVREKACRKVSSAWGLKAPSTSSSMMIRLTSSRSASMGRRQPMPSIGQLFRVDLTLANGCPVG